MIWSRWRDEGGGNLKQWRHKEGHAGGMHKTRLALTRQSDSQADLGLEENLPHYRREFGANARGVMKLRPPPAARTQKQQATVTNVT